MKTRLEFSGGSSNKFWEIEVSGASHTVRYGRIGSDGKTQTKSFASEEAALAAAEKLRDQKLAKGYVAAGGSAGGSKKAATQKTAKPRGRALRAAPHEEEKMGSGCRGSSLGWPR